MGNMAPALPPPALPPPNLPPPLPPPGQFGPHHPIVHPSLGYGPLVAGERRHRYATGMEPQPSGAPYGPAPQIPSGLGYGAMSREQAQRHSAGNWPPPSAHGKGFGNAEVLSMRG